MQLIVSCLWSTTILVKQRLILKLFQSFGWYCKVNCCFIRLLYKAWVLPILLVILNLRWSEIFDCHLRKFSWVKDLAAGNTFLSKFWIFQVTRSKATKSSTIHSFNKALPSHSMLLRDFHFPNFSGSIVWNKNYF